MDAFRTRLKCHNVAAAAVAVSVSLFALTAPSPAFAAKKDNAIVFAAEQVPQNVDAYFNNLVIGAVVADQIWDTLVYRNQETGAYQPGLATAWRWVDDKTLELDLRRGVKFHNGAEFDADDVVYTLNFVSKPENKVLSTLPRWVDHAEKLDRYKVRIALKRPFPAALAYLANPRFTIYPHEYYAKVGPKGMNEKPIGTGPFLVVEHVLGKYIRLERNSDYFKDSPKPQPKIERVEIRFIPDAQTRVAEVVAGGVDLIMNVAPDQAEQLREVPRLQIVSGESARIAYLQLDTLPNTPSPPLRDVRVRQAIMHAIDREAMVKYLVGNNARVLHSECHPSQFGCTDEGVARYAYDPAKARRLLAEAGYPKGFDIDIYAYRDRNQIEAVIGFLNAAGIRAHLRFLQTAAVVSALRGGKVAIGAYGISAGMGDVTIPLSFLHGFSSDDVNRDPELRDLVVRGDSSMDPNIRKQAYAKALQLIAERAYVVPLYSLPTYYVVAKDLAFKSHPDDVPRFYEMSWK